jgi:hypothetical protein
MRTIEEIYEDIAEFYALTGVYDIVKLDHYLKSEYGNYENRNISMKDFLLEKFGKETTNQFKEVFGIIN